MQDFQQNKSKDQLVLQ